MRKLIENIVVVICSVICVATNYIISQYHENPLVSGIISVVVAGAVGAVFVFGSLFLDRLRFFRLMFEPLSEHEGYWFHKLKIDDAGEDKRKYGFFHFAYDSVSNSYVYTGRDYDENGNIICSCEFKDIRTNNSKGFLYTGTVTKGRSNFDNLGKFIVIGKRNGDGYFSNIGSASSVNGSYTGCQLRREDIQRLLGTLDVSGDNFDKLGFEYYKESLTK